MADIDTTSPWPEPRIAALLRPCTVPVPLLGAGTSVPAGLPTGERLADWIRAHELADGVDFSRLSHPGTSGSPLLVSQWLIDSFPERRQELHDAVREYFIDSCGAATITQQLRDLARTPGRLILTLNYDDLIERAARDQGIEVEPLGREDLPRVIGRGLPRPDDPLQVVHLHGRLDDPAPLVLANDEYARTMGDHDVAALFAWVLAERNFCVLGTSFEEPHLAAILQRFRCEPARNVIVCQQSIAEQIRSNAPSAPLSFLHGVQACGYPDGRHEVVASFCERLVTCDDTEAEAGLVVAPDAVPRDPRYTNRELLRVDLEEDPEVALLVGRGELIDEAGLQHRTRAVVVGVPGSGKTELLKYLAANPVGEERPALIRLRSIRDVVGPPEALLTQWLATADPAFGLVPPEQAIDGRARVHLLLDALDEQPPAERRAAADAITRVGRAFPQLRITLTTRRTSAVDDIDADWPRYELRCTPEWRREFLAGAGTSAEQLNDRLGPAQTAVQPLLDIPFFLRRLTELTDVALADAVQAGDVLSIITALLERQIDADPNLVAVAASVRFWLADVALLMQLSGRRACDTEALRPLTERLDLGDVDLLTDRLANRSLLEDEAGQWSFVHRLFADALVADAIGDDDPAAWIDIIAPTVGDRSGLREEWGPTFELLAARSSHWRMAVAGRDRVAAARCTPATAPPEERRHAVRELWTRAERLQIWIDGHFSGEPDDAAIIARLVAAGDIDDEIPRFEEALATGSRYDRANALDILVSLEPGFADRRIEAVITEEPDSTVRRNAASWAGRLGLRSLADTIIARACAPEDDAEAGDMASIGLRLTDPADRPAVGRRMLAAGNREVHEHHIFDEVPAIEQLRWLRDVALTDPDEARYSGERRVDELLGELGDVSDNDAAVVGELLALSEAMSPTALAWASAHPAAAAGVAPLLRDGAVRPHEIARLLLRFGSDALAAADAPPDAIETVRAWEDARRRAAAQPPPERDDERQVEERPTLSTVLDLPRDERFSVLVRQYAALERQVESASEDARATLRHVVSEEWGDRDLRDGIRLTEDGATVTHWAHLVMTYGPASAFPLTDDRWVQAATCGWLFTPQVRWLRSQATQPRLDHASAQTPADVRRIRALLEIGTGLDLGSVVGRIDELDAAQIESQSGSQLLDALARAGQVDTLRALGNRMPSIEDAIAPLLAAAGDLEAQRHQLEALRNRLTAGERVDRHGTPWLEAVEAAELLDLLVEVVVAEKSHGREAGPFDAADSALTAIERIGGRDALEILDRLIGERPWPGAQWLYRMRDSVLQRELTVAAAGASRRAVAERGWVPPAG